MEKQSYSSTDLFSNCMTGESAGKKNENTILPGKGEVWSCTRTGPLKFKNSDLENCEYDVVEVLDQNGFQISALSWEFLCTELLRFYHQFLLFDRQKRGVAVSEASGNLIIQHCLFIILP
jgi:hypothetical protein